MNLREVRILNKNHETCQSDLHVPLFTHGVDHTALDGASAGPADGDAHLVVAGQTVELALQLPGVSSQLLPVEAETIKTYTVHIMKTKIH